MGIFYPHGMAPGYWVPEQEGALPEKLPLILESLKKVKDQTVVLSGIWSKSAEPPEGTTGSDHWVAAAFLTGIKPRKTAGSDATVGSPTIDQIIARKIGQETLLPSLQLAVEDPNSSSSNCGEGYSCSYTNSISWIDLPTPANEPMERTSPLPMELNPQVVFERLFGSGATPEVRAARMRQNRSILDSVLGELAGLKKELGAGDRRTVDQYTDEIREIERRIQLAAKASSQVPAIDLPPGVPEQFDDHIKLQFDLAALAFQADITRVATLLGARDLTGRSYPFPKSELFPNGGVSVGFHGGSHHQDDPTQIRRYADLNRYHVSTLAYFAREAAVDSRRRRHAARSLADALRHEHGQLESASALRRAAHPGRRRQRSAEGQPSPGLRAEDGDHRQPAAERAGHVRHPPGEAGRQRRPAGETARTREPLNRMRLLR